MTIDEDRARDAGVDRVAKPRPRAETRPPGAGPAASSAPPSAPRPQPADQAAGRASHTEAGEEPATLFEAAHAIPRALQIAGSIVAPTTLLTALFVYFGLMYAIAYYRYFGVNYTVLNVPIQGYLILSVSTAVLPMALIAAAALLALWLYQMRLDSLAAEARRIMYYGVYPLVGLLGLALVTFAAVDTLMGIAMYPVAMLEARGLSLSIGVVLLGYAGRLRRELAPRRSTHRASGDVPLTLTVAKWGSCCLLLAIGLFWAVGSYAIRMGMEGAQGFARSLRCAPDVVLYSEKDLNFKSSGLSEETPSASDVSYGYRYSGLKLVPQAGDSYLLIPADWSPGGRAAIVLPRSDSVRLEFLWAPSKPPGC
jgi:hypothetical protein